MWPFFINKIKVWYLYMKILARVQYAIRQGNFDEAREVLSQQSQTFLVNDFGPSFVVEPEQQIDLSYADLQKDYGGGRVSRGLIFLELVSLSKKGKNLNSVLLFDRIPQYASVKALDFAKTTDDKIRFVSESLGIGNLVSELSIYKKDLHENTKTRLVEVFDQVNSGTFLRKNNEDVLSFLRKSVRTLKISKERLVIR